MPRLIGLAVTDEPTMGQHFVENIKRIWADGDAFAPIDYRLPTNERERVIAALRPSAIIEGTGAEQPLPLGMPTEIGDAVVVATSGTSGQPKGVIHTHDSVAASARATGAALSVDPEIDKWLACLPLSHIGGLAVVLRSIVSETAVEIHPKFDAKSVISAAGAGATLVSLVTRALNQVPPALFRKVLIGGAAPPPDRAPNVIATYGMTETGSGIIYDKTPLDGIEISLATTETAQRESNKTELGKSTPGKSEHSGAGDPVEHSGAGDPVEGEILLRGPMLFRGYRSGPTPFLSDGWFPTGDLGFWSQDGALVVKGRASDVIVTGGEKVWPGPIETMLKERADIDQVALVGRPDPEWGHRVVAVVVPADQNHPPSLEALREQVKASFGPWCAPKTLEIRAALPKTSLGKVRKAELAEPG